MARRKKTTTTTTSSTSNYSIVKLCAYWGLVIAAIAALLIFVFRILAICGVTISWSGRLVSVCSTVAQIALLIAVLIPAYNYSRGKNAVYKAFFWVAVILIVLGLVGINLI